MHEVTYIKIDHTQNQQYLKNWKSHKKKLRNPQSAIENIMNNVVTFDITVENFKILDTAKEVFDLHNLKSI